MKKYALMIKWMDDGRIEFYDGFKDEYRKAFNQARSLYNEGYAIMECNKEIDLMGILEINVETGAAVTLLNAKDLDQALEQAVKRDKWEADEAATS